MIRYILYHTVHIRVFFLALAITLIDSSTTSFDQAPVRDLWPESRPLRIRAIDRQ